MVNLAYLAGFFDGEGTVGIYLMKQKKQSHGAIHVLAMSACGQVREPLMCLQEAFGGKISQHKERGRDWVVYRWWARTDEATTALEEMLPFLTVKLRQAKLALRYRREAGSPFRHGSGQSLPDKIFARREWYKSAIQCLKTRDKEAAFD